MLTRCAAQQTDILQLDVTWLFDDFDGGGPDTSGGNYVSSAEYSGVPTVPTVPTLAASTSSQSANESGSEIARKTLPWADIQKLVLPQFRK